MKKVILSLVAFLSIATIFTSCTKKEVETLTTQSLTATVGTSAFTAKEVNSLIAPNPNANWTGKKELSITGSDGNHYISIAIMDWNDSNPVMDYSFNYPNATVIGGYNSGTSSDDIVTSGVLHITTNLAGVYLGGTFDVITQLGVHITNGYFYAKIK